MPALPSVDSQRPEAPSSALSWTTIGLYGFPTIAVQFIYMLVMVMYMNFATDVLLIAPAVMGAIFFASKLWDAVSDPVVGFLSDRTRSRLGRRRSWMLGSALPVAAFGLMMWAPPDGLSPTLLTLWVGVAIFGFYTTYTTFYVPQLALGAELSFKVQERNRLYGSRQIGSAIGLLLAFSLGAPLLEHHETARATAVDLGWAAGVACLLSISIATLLLPREPIGSEGRGGRNLFTAMRDVARNPHARILLFVFFIESFGVGGTSVMAPYVVKYVIKLEGILGIVLMAYVVPTALSIPVWVWLAQHFERHKLWMISMGMSAIGYASLIFLDEGRLGVMLFCSVMCGTGSGCGATLGQAIKADVIDYDEYVTGERKEGSYFALWAFVSKLASGLMIALVGFALSWSGYAENTEQPESIVNVMLLLNGGIPFLCFAVGIAVFTRFRLDSREHQRIRDEIDRRASRT